MSMYLTKSMTAENGAAVAHHRIQRVEIGTDLATVRVWGESWVNLEAHESGLGSIWRWYLQAAAGDLDLTAGLGSALMGLATASEWFTGATVTTE